MQIVQQLIYHTVNEFHYIIHRLKSLRIFMSIYAAIRYAVGAGAYGYLGLGDVFVFLFFRREKSGQSRFVQSERCDRYYKVVVLIDYIYWNISVVDPASAGPGVGVPEDEHRLATGSGRSLVSRADPATQHQLKIGRAHV